jgi:hypothetical protein
LQKTPRKIQDHDTCQRRNAACSTGRQKERSQPGCPGFKPKKSNKKADQGDQETDGCNPGDKKDENTTCGLRWVLWDCSSSLSATGL